jgi:hypothetical protein
MKIFVNEIFKNKEKDPNGYNYNFMFAHSYAFNEDEMNADQKIKIYKYLNVTDTDPRIPEYKKKLKEFISLMLQKDPTLKKLVNGAANNDSNFSTDNPMATDNKSELPSKPGEPVKSDLSDRFASFANTTAIAPASKHSLLVPSKRRTRGGKFRRSKTSKNKTKYRRK